MNQVILLFTLAFATITSLQASVLFSDALAAYNMEELSGNLVDVSSNGHNSNNALGGATVTTDAFGGGALLFDGSDQIRINDAPSLRLQRPFTIEAAFRMDGQTNGDWVRVVGKGTSTNRNYGLWYRPDGTFLFQNGSSNCCDIQARINQPVNNGQWYHMAGVYDGSSAKLYIDGVLVASESYNNQTLRTDSEPLTIGGADFHTLHVGAIDNVAIFDSALSTTDIQQHAQNTATNSAIPEPSSFILLGLALLLIVRSF